MNFSNDSINRLRDDVKERLSKERYIHTLGVESLAKELGKVIIPEFLTELSVAALLHDIAKELSTPDQLALLASSGLSLTQEDLDTLPALHSFAAIPVIRSCFAEYADENVLSAVYNHTLGNPGMSIFDEIIFIADYAESGRKYEACQEVNRYLSEHISPKNAPKENLMFLHNAVVQSINHTIESLAKRGKVINNRTLKTKEYFEKISNIPNYN